jgi:ribA/ribD-fused uncharacterized protein
MQQPVETPTHIFFCDPVDSTYGVLSSHYLCPIEDEGKVFNSAEQFMMYHKALLFLDTESANKILAATDPEEMKQLGRKISNFKQDLWDKFKAKIVLKGTILKFTQHKILKNILIGTGTKHLCEDFPGDMVWGIGLSAEEAMKTDPKTWPGQNLLGIILEKARYIANGGSSTPKTEEQIAKGNEITPGILLLIRQVQIQEMAEELGLYDSFGQEATDNLIVAKLAVEAKECGVIF